MNALRHVSVRGLPVLCAFATLTQLAAAPALAAGPNDSGPYAGYSLYVEPGGNASLLADQLRSSDPAAAARMDRVAAAPISLWVGDWLGDPRAYVDDALTRAGDQLQVLTVYSIPDRDCGAYSAGGVSDAGAYNHFVSEVAAGLEGRLAIVVLEPDALAHVSCLDDAGLAERHAMLANAVDTLTWGGAEVYIDAGDSNWIPAEDMAHRLIAAGVQRAAGFALNVSHTEFTEDEAAYAQELRNIVGHDAHYVVDTSRNGLGPAADNEWCNPMGRAHGPFPTLQVYEPGLDALLWIKRPGESDGTCHGGPPAGMWWADYALGLAEQAGY